MAPVVHSRVIALLATVLAGAALAAPVPDGTMVFTAAGDGTWECTGDGTPAKNAQLKNPSDVAVRADGSFYISDNTCSRVRLVGTDGFILAAAGNGTAASAGDGGLATAASFWFAESVAVGPSGDYYVADYNGNSVRKIDHVTGIIDTWAGAGAGLATPESIAVIVDPATGNEHVYVGCYGNATVKRITAKGVAENVAGIVNVFGYSGDGGAATAAQINSPWGLAFDPDGNLIIADSNNFRIRKVDKVSGVINTIAGGGTGTANGTPALSAQIMVHGMDYGADGNLYFSNGNLISKLGTDGNIYTVAGNGTGAYYGDGIRAIDASFWSIGGISFDSAGRLYVADSQNKHVRVLTIPMPVITKEMSLPGPTERGTVITYTLGWKNIGSGTVFNLTLTDPLPNHLEIVGADTPFAQADSLGTPVVTASSAAAVAGPWTAGAPVAGTVSPVLRWVVDRVEPGKSGLLRFRTRIRDTVTDGFLLSNQASATLGVDGQVYRTAVLTATAYVAPAPTGPTGPTNTQNQEQLLDKVRAGAKLIVAPNVFDLSNPASQVTIAVKGEAGKDVEIVIYNESGDIVKTKKTTLGSDGTNLCTYDGKDDGGKLLAPGIYWAQVKGTRDKKRFVVVPKKK